MLAPLGQKLKPKTMMVRDTRRRISMSALLPTIQGIQQDEISTAQLCIHRQ
jgi:hypothetical protein